MTSESTDDLVVELLGLLHEYEALVNGEYRDGFVDGFLNLSRAKFNTSKVLGVDDFDMSEYSACKKVGFEGKWELVDLLDVQREKEKEKEAKGKEVQKEKERKEVKREKEHKKEQEGKVQSFSTSTNIGKRTISTATEEVHVSLKDPINQFGGLVPYQLRQAQTSFNKALYNCIKVLNLQKKILKVVSEIESINGNVQFI